jgi:hypothetical protein
VQSSQLPDLKRTSAGRSADLDLVAFLLAHQTAADRRSRGNQPLRGSLSSGVTRR